MRGSPPRCTCAVLALLWACLLVPSPALARPSPAPSRPPAAGPPVLGATSAILVNVGTRRVLYAKDVHAHLPPASLTKIVTALVARAQYRLDDTVVVTDGVKQVQSERLGLEPGMQMTVRDLLYGMLLLSANDAAETLAAHDPLGEADFVAKMNAEARQLGGTDSTFMNPHGLDQPGHVSSAWDMAIFARRLLADPVLAQIVATKTYPIPWTNGTQRVIQNHNKLLWRYPGTIGVKTGYTNQAGNCLVAAAASGAGTALTVVLHSPDHYRETAALFDFFKTGPLGVVPALSLATPRPTTAPHTVRGVVTKPAVPIPNASISNRWVAMPMVLLAASMLLTLRRPRRRHPLADATELHPALEPLARDEVL